jgi:cellulose synthase/poly-beta-1,6-N-acetylglucosamine synthase-like glycosyltransferase
VYGTRSFGGAVRMIANGNPGDSHDAGHPRVSVVIPTRDRPQLLREALASVRAQTFTDYEIVTVINGPETASTVAAAEACAGLNVVRIAQSGIAVAPNGSRSWTTTTNGSPTGLRWR